MCGTLQALLLTALCVIVASQSQEVGEDCSDPVECDEDPCRNAICPRFLNARCQSDNCSGTCTARFFHFKGPDVTHNCDVVTCKERECSENRVCVEEVYPPSCPDGNIKCRQYIKTRCELLPKPLPPADCTQIACPIDMVCVVEQTRRGPVARCRSPPSPTSCDEIKCDDGMECFQRDRVDKPPVVRCVPRKVSPFPRDCSAVTCSRGTVCMVFGRLGNNPQARCVNPPRLTCEDLDCKSSFMVCRESNEGSRCELAQDCNELQCPDDLICQHPFIGNSGTPTCIVPHFERDCTEIQCTSDQTCVLWGFLRRSITAAFCYPTQQLPMVMPPRSQPMCANALNTCESGSNQVCMDLLQESDRNGNKVTCNQIDCGAVSNSNRPPCIEPGDHCYELPRDVAILTNIRHTCIAEEGGIEFNTKCSIGRHTPCLNNSKCTDVSHNGVIIGTICDAHYSVLPTNCDEAACSGENECFLLEFNGVNSVATCAPSVFVAETVESISPYLYI